jgi:hypothetical protein
MNAQKNGIVFIENLGKMGDFLFSRTVFPAKLKAKLDKLVIGTLPAKMKALT